MLDLLRILLCGIGALYLAVRFGRLLFSTTRGYPLWPPADGPVDDRSHAGTASHVTRTDV